MTYFRSLAPAMTLLAVGAACGSDVNLVTCIEDPSQLGCAPQGAGTGNQTIINIGVVAPLTGNASGSGNNLINAATLAFSEIDNVIGPYRIRLIPIDSESSTNPAGTAERYRAAMREQNLVAAMLNWHSGVAIELMDAAADAEMAHLFGLGAANAINDKYASNPERYRVWSAKGWPQPSTYVQSYLDLLECLLTPACTEATSAASWSPGSQSIYVVTEPGPWGDAFEIGATQNVGVSTGFWAQNGWTVAGSVELLAEDDATEISRKANEVASSGASVVLMTSTDDDFGQFIQALRQAADPDPIIVAEGLGWSQESLDSAGLAAVGVLDGGFAPYNGDAARVEDVTRFREEYERRFGVPPSSSSAGLGYDYSRFAIAVLRRALEKTGAITRESVLDVYANEVRTGQLTFDSGVVMGQYAYDQASVPDPQYGIGKYYFPVYQYQGPGMEGAINTATVFPAVLKDADVVVP